MSKKLFFLAVCFIAVSAVPANGGKVIEVRQKADLNPSIFFAGFPENPALSKELKTFLGVCGWFEPTNDGNNADFSLTAENSGNTVLVRLYQFKTPAAAWKFRNSGNARTMAKIITDTVIEYTFKQLQVKGFCRSRIAFSAETSPGIRNIFTCDIDGGNIEQISNYRCLNVEPSWNPNGQSIFFSKYNRSGIDIVEMSVGKRRLARLISSSRGINTGAALSPDGTTLAMILSPDHKVDLYTKNLANGKLRRLTSGITVEASPAWSPDGSQLVFVSDRSGNPRLYTVSARGGALRRLPTIGNDAVTPAWSKNDQIAYATRINGQYTIAVYNLKTGENKRVVEAAGNWESPEWAADNRQIVCKRTLGSSCALYVIDTKTGNQRLLLRTSHRLFDPSWSPCKMR